MGNFNPIRHARKVEGEGGITQKELSKRTGIDQTAISQYERDERVPTNPKNKAALCANLEELEIDDLVDHFEALQLTE